MRLITLLSMCVWASAACAQDKVPAGQNKSAWPSPTTVCTDGTRSDPGAKFRDDANAIAKQLATLTAQRNK